MTTSSFVELIVCRVDRDVLLVPLSEVARVVPAEAPVRAPGARARPPVVTLDGQPVQVWFGAAFFGASQVTLEPSDQMLVLRGTSPVVLWVSAVEEVLEVQPQPARPEDGPLVAGWCPVEGRALPVLALDSFRTALSAQEQESGS